MTLQEWGENVLEPQQVETLLNTINLNKGVLGK